MTVAPDPLEALVRYPESGERVIAFVSNHNDYPREALLEALLRYLEEDLAAE